jgi:AraC family transcriptional regulator of adaptative response/methylated-DNA-[protein]-cysteine methyltransferase
MTAYETIARTLRYLDAAVEDQPDLATVAEVAGLEPQACQRLFSGMVGISPKKFLQCLTVERAKQALVQGQSVLDAAYEAGLSGPGRLHDLFLTLEAVSPGDYKSGGLGLCLRHGVAETPFGPARLVWREEGAGGVGLMGLGFMTAQTDSLDLLSPWFRADLHEDRAGAQALADRIFRLRTSSEERGSPLRLLVSGTAFQVQVWRALLRVPAGALVSYETVARMIGRPTAARAVGNAVGANPVAFLIPCHRVVRQTGALGSYRWGEATKRLIIGAEACLAAAE